MNIDRRRAILATAGLSLAVLVGCGGPVESMTQSGSSDPPFPSSSLSFADPSESEEPSAPPPPPAAEGMAGTWDGTWAIDGYGNTGEFTMELAPSGDGFSGPIESTNTDCPTGTVDLTLDGSSVTMGWVLSGVPVSFIGTKDGDSMSGTWSAISCSQNVPLTGIWDATKR